MASIFDISRRGDREVERGAPAWCAVDPGATSVRFDDTLNDRESATRGGTSAQRARVSRLTVRALSLARIELPRDSSAPPGSRWTPPRDRCAMRLLIVRLQSILRAEIAPTSPRPVGACPLATAQASYWSAALEIVPIGHWW